MILDRVKDLLAEMDQTRAVLSEYDKKLKDLGPDSKAALQALINKAEADRKEMEKQKQATMNILEDIAESQEKLKDANKELEQRSFELEALKSLNDDLGGSSDINEALQILNHYLRQFVFFVAGTYLVINPSEENGYVYTTFLNGSVSENLISSVRKDLLDYFSENKKSADESIVRLVKNINPEIAGLNLNNEFAAELKDKIVLPMKIGERNLGVVHLAIIGDQPASADSKKIASAMLMTFSFFLDRLQTVFLAQNSKTISLVESLNNGVIMYNDKRDIALVNPAAARFLGLSEKECDIKTIDSRFPELKIKNYVDEVLSTGKSKRIDEVTLLERFYEIIYTPVKDNRKHIVGCSIIFHDITHLKEISQMKTEFVSVASHQLRTPLTAIKLFTEMLYKEQVGSLNADQKEYLNNVNQSTDRMARLVNDLLNVTRIESGRLRIDPQPTELNDFIRKIISEAEVLANIKHLHVNFSDCQGLPAIPLDQNLVRQVVHNLVMNAIRYTPAGRGDIEVAVKPEDENNVLISVQDKGIGIPEEIKHRMFEKFFRADNAIKTETEGTGLGLYVCKMIVESSGGKIWFESTLNRGTTFFVLLPLKGMKKKEGERGMIIS